MTRNLSSACSLTRSASRYNFSLHPPRSLPQVESLTAARKSAMAGSEPSDAIRVVNALLTQIDQIKRHPNVVILTTSNVTGAIDLAFVDRYIYRNMRLKHVGHCYLGKRNVLYI